MAVRGYEECGTPKKYVLSLATAQVSWQVLLPPGEGGPNGRMSFEGVNELQDSRLSVFPSSMRRGGHSPSQMLVSDHPVWGIKVGFADIFLMPQPPLLTRRGINLP
jgi:hypothetical protein